MNQSISIGPISLEKTVSVARQLNQCSTAKSMKQSHGINWLSGVAVSKGERPRWRDVSSDFSSR